MKGFLENTYYVDYTSPNIMQKAKELFLKEMTDVQGREKEG